MTLPLLFLRKNTYSMKKILFMVLMVWGGKLFGQPRYQSGQHNPFDAGDGKDFYLDGGQVGVLESWKSFKKAKDPWLATAEYEWTGTKWISLDTGYTSYDGNGNLLTEKRDSKNNNYTSWERFCNYDANDNLDSEITKYWDTTKKTYVNSLLENHDYDAKNNQTLWLEYFWNDTKKKFIHQSKSSWTYDSAGRKNSYLFEYYWDTTIQAYPDSIKERGYKYDSNNNLITFFECQNWDTTSGDWDITYVDSFWYDSNNNLILSSRMYSPAPNSYYKRDKASFTYDSNNNLISHLVQFWDGNKATFIDSDLDSFSYDKNNNLLSDFHRYFIGNHGYNGVIVYSWHDTYTYNSNGNLTSYLYQWADTTNKVLKNASKGYYYYGTNTNLKEETKTPSSFRLFPNPASSTITIQYPSLKKEELTIINMLGEVVYRQILFPQLSTLHSPLSTTLDISHFPGGIYLVNIGGNSGKLIVEN